jgi:hypothetical protein
VKEALRMFYLIPQRTTQRDLMRKLFALHGPDEDAVCRAYAQAERDGLIIRKRNEGRQTPEQYAAMLWRDAMKNGWAQS